VFTESLNSRLLCVQPNFRNYWSKVSALSISFGNSGGVDLMADPCLPLLLNSRRSPDSVDHDVVYFGNDGGVTSNLTKYSSFHAAKRLVRQCQHVHQLQKGCRNISLRASRSKMTQTCALSKTGLTIFLNTAKTSPQRTSTPARVSTSQSRLVRTSAC